jgi:hypothetical protein
MNWVRGSSVDSVEWGLMGDLMEYCELVATEGYEELVHGIGAPTEPSLSRFFASFCRCGGAQRYSCCRSRPQGLARRRGGVGVIAGVKGKKINLCAGRKIRQLKLNIQNTTSLKSVEYGCSLHHPKS